MGRKKKRQQSQKHMKQLEIAWHVMHPLDNLVWPVGPMVLEESKKHAPMILAWFLLNRCLDQGFETTRTL
jgi:hypothetical protein